jgi:ubiquinone/menaquinone biosynthesis C-methylase UbiE
MRLKPRWTAVWLFLLLSVPTLTRAQVAADSREKTEKVSKILAALQAEAGKRIADVGAGEGFYALRIARAVEPNGRVTAVDVSDKYLENLRARLQQDNVTNVDVVVGAVDDPRLSENTFDAVLIYNAYHEMTAPEPILKAIFRALKPGGRLVMSEPLHDYVRGATRAEQVKEHEIGPNFVQQELQAAGFEVIEQRPDFLAFTAPGHKGGFWLMVARRPERQEAIRSAETRMPCSCCTFGNSADQHFDAKKVEKELAQYRKKGPGPTTRGLRDGLLSAGLREGTLLDIGGGLGLLSLELLDAGFSRTIVVDASAAYLAAASEEASRRGRSASTEFVHGDFVLVATESMASTVVTLDRVVCCYPAYEPLLEQALQLARTGFAVSYPRDRWFVRLGLWLENAMRRRSGNPFRTFLHPPSEMTRLIELAGFRLASRRRTPAWSADVFVKPS